ncbi:MAG: hypothetical protein ACTSPI_10315 [Candidatus Heimdallarchaeaceae archaeon]
METISTKIQKANKEHVCDWCGEKIQKGEVYEVQTNVSEGSVYRWKTHLKCIKIFNELDMCNYDDGDGIDADTFNTAVQEYLYEKLGEDELEELDDAEYVDKALELLKKNAQ